jgi:calcineurin-like phosphoesterase family protein
VKSNIWLTSDWHFGHQRLVERGYRPDGFENRIEKRLLAIIRPGDLLVHLGDVALHPGGEDRARDLLARLHPDVVCCLIRGNHDSGSLSKYRRMGFDWTCDSMSLDWGGLRFTFSHEPRAEGDINLHGHLHGGTHHPTAPDQRCLLISMELTDYRPVSIRTVHALRCTPEWRGDRFCRWEGVR